MAKNALADACSAPIRLCTMDLVGANPEKDQLGEVATVCNFVRDRIRYLGDVFDVETLQLPRDTLALGQGDCDDKAALVAAMLISVGYPVQFAILERDQEFVHVWTQVNLYGCWMDLETTEQLPAGRPPPLQPGDQVHAFEVTGL